MENEMQEVKVVVGEDNLATYICPKCGFLMVEDVSEHVRSEEPVRARCECQCGYKYTVFLERRRFYRKPTRLSGTCTRSDVGMAVTVLDISRAGLKFRVDGASAIEVGDDLYIELELGDRDHSMILRKVKVKSVAGPYVGAELVRPEPSSRLTSYLYFDDE